MNREKEELAEFMHNEYESYAKRVGWKTQEECQTLFDELPPANKEVMLWVAKSVSDKLRQQERERIIEEIEDMVEGMKLPREDGEGGKTFHVGAGSNIRTEGYNQAIVDVIEALKEKKDKLN